MAKRISLSERRASDARGVDVLFGGAPATDNSATADSAAFETETTAETTGAEAAKMESSSVPGATGATSVGTLAKPALAKVTIYIRPEQVFAIESIQLAQRQSTGQKPDKSELLQEAVDLLIAKYQS